MREPGAFTLRRGKDGGTGGSADSGTLAFVAGLGMMAVALLYDRLGHVSHGIAFAASSLAAVAALLEPRPGGRWTLLPIAVAGMLYSAVMFFR